MKKKKYDPETKSIFVPIAPNGQLDLGFSADTAQELADAYKLGRNERVAEFRFVRTVARPNRKRAGRTA